MICQKWTDVWEDTSPSYVSPLRFKSEMKTLFSLFSRPKKRLTELSMQDANTLLLGTFKFPSFWATKALLLPSLPPTPFHPLRFPSHQGTRVGDRTRSYCIPRHCLLLCLLRAASASALDSSRPILHKWQSNDWQRSRPNREQEDLKPPCKGLVAAKLPL